MRCEFNKIGPLTGVGEVLPFLSLLEPECGTSDKLLLVVCEDGNLQACDVRNRKTVSCMAVGTRHVRKIV